MKIVPLQSEHLEEGLPSCKCLDLRPLKEIPAWFPPYSHAYLDKVQEQRERRRDFFQYLVKKYGSAGLLALQRRNVIGWLTFFPKEEARRIGWIRSADDYFNKETLVLGCLFVKEKRRNKGVGTELVKAWKNWAKDNYWRYLEAAARGNFDEAWYGEKPLKNNGFHYIEERITFLEFSRAFKIYRCDLMENKVEKWVQVWEDEPYSVEVVKGFLESHGVPTILESDVVFSVHPFTKGPLGEVRIKVPAEMEKRALSLLREIHEKGKEISPRLFNEEKQEND